VKLRIFLHFTAQILSNRQLPLIHHVACRPRKSRAKLFEESLTTLENLKQPKKTSSSKAGRSGGKDTRRTRPATANHTSSSGPPDISFLFIVKEFNITLEPIAPDHQPLTDQWHNYVPPTKSEAYTEVPGNPAPTVFRFRRGEITVARGYSWTRGPDGPGYIYKKSTSEGEHLRIPVETYRTTSIFHCSPFLPLVVTPTDASLGYTFYRQSGYNPDYDTDVYKPWELLHFEDWYHKGYEGLEGVSYANSVAAGAPCVVGKNPSWIPTLVPRAFQNTGSGLPDSQGLSGDVSLIIGMMAFHSRPSGPTIDQVFAGVWRHCRLHVNTAPTGCKSNLVHAMLH
jgi:hypothetical protein